MRHKIKILILITFLVSCSSKKEEPVVSEEIVSDIVALTPAQIKNAGIETGNPQERVMNSELNVNGLVDVPPQNIVSVSFPIGGYLKSTNLLPGMHVSKGQVIAWMEDQALVQLQQDYLITSAKLEFLRLEYERQKMLNENNVNADKVYQLAKSEYFSQKILLKGYSEKLKLLHINPDKLTESSVSRSVPLYSQINGFVSKVNVNIGKYVTPSDVLFELINPDDMHAALTVFEKDIAKVKPRQSVLVSFVDDPTVEYPCEVLLITKNVNEDRTALVHCHFVNQPKKLLPGMFLNAKINIMGSMVTAVPEEAVVRYGNTEYVVESKGSNNFSLIAVTTGIKSEGWVELTGTDKEFLKKILVLKNPYPVLSALKNTAEE
ncbi:MAG: efflux RND transporter periplasmic adaptor subunit [Chitinophagaceae bacterium]